MSARGRTVVVGINESSGAEAALQWAIDDARLRQARVTLIYAYEWQLRYGQIPIYVDVPASELQHSRDAAEQFVAKMIDRARTLGPEIEISGAAIDGDPAGVLIDESADASLLVLGSRHLKALGSVVIGSVSASAAARASCPAVVVRGPAGSLDEGAAVIVGVDGTEASETVLEFGFKHASRHQAPLRAVLCWHPGLVALAMGRPQPSAPPQVEAWLSEALAGWRERYPDVEVHAEVIREHPSDGLLIASMSQHLLVVGSRGRHAITGTLLGSTSQGVLHHATCPVAVVPTHGA
jgi:nucleotide-binding universal stress UspA family protein